MSWSKMVGGWFQEAGADYNDFIKALFLGNVKAMNTYMNRVAMTTFSYFHHSVPTKFPVGVWSVDTGKRPSQDAEPERLHSVKATTMGLTEPNPSDCFYHGFVLGLMVELSDRYVVLSNRESGFGRYDVMLESKKSGEDGIILEFKVRDPEDEKSLQDTVQAALEQIEEKQYGAVLEISHKIIPND